MNRQAGAVFVALLIGLLVGGLGGYVLFSAEPVVEESSRTTDQRTEKSPTPADAKAQGRDSDVAPDLFHAEAEREDIERGSTAPPELESVNESIKSVLADVPAPRKNIGPMSLTGTVLDQDQKPLEGVTIIARESNGRSIPGRAGDGKPTPSSLDKRVRTTVMSYYQSQASRYEVVTDASGHFRFDQLEDALFRVNAYMEGYEFSLKGDRSSKVRAGESVEFQGTCLVQVPITVTLLTGGSPDMAVIEFRESSSRNPDYWNRQLWDLDTPFVRIAPGSYELKATLNRERSRNYSGEDLTSDPLSVELAANVETAPLAFTLRGCPGIRGNVHFPPSLIENQGSLVYLKLVGADGNVSPESLSQSDISEWVSNTRTSFEFRDLDPGTYAIGVSRTYNTEIVAHEVVTVSDSFLTQDLTIPELSAGEYIHVAITAPGDAEIGDLAFSLKKEAHRGSRSSGVFATSTGEGSYSVEPDSEFKSLLEPTWPEGVSYILRVKSTTFGSKSIDLQPGRLEYAIRFEEPATLIVTLNGFVREEHQDSVKVRLTRGNDNSYRQSRNPWDADGTLELGPYEPGDYELHVSLNEEGGRYSSNQEVLEFPVSLHVGENRVPVTLPSLYEVIVSFPDADVGTFVALQGKTHSGRTESLEINESREITLKNLPPGEYRLQTRSGTREMMHFEVPGPRRLVFQGQPINCLEVTVTDPSKDLGTAGFVSGDVVIAIDRKSFENLIELQGVMVAAMAESTMKLTVLRAGRELQLDLKTKGIVNGSGLGGELEPSTR